MSLRNTALGITERLPRAMRKKRVRGAHLNAVRPQNSCESYRAESALAKNIVLIVVCWRGLDTVRFPSDFFLIASFTTTARNSSVFSRRGNSLGSPRLNPRKPAFRNLFCQLTVIVFMVPGAGLEPAQTFRSEGF